jgi:putative ABC transport system permease protein
MTSAFYAAASAFLVKPFSFDPKDSLLMVYQPPAPASGKFLVSQPDIVDLRNESRTLLGVAAYKEADKTLDAESGRTPVVGIAVDPYFFPLLSIYPSLGREFSSTDEMKEAPRVVILSHAFWQREFSGERAIIGRRILLDREPYTVIGVMPSSFSFFSDETPTDDIWLPLRTGIDRRGYHDKSAIARLKPNVSLKQADAEIRLISDSIARAYPMEKGFSFTLQSFRNIVLGQLQSIAWVLGILSSGTLLIVCFNVAGICLIEAQASREEVELRTALGGTRWQVSRPFLQRAVLRASLGAAGGIAVSTLLLHLMRSILPPGLPGVTSLHVDSSVLLFAVSIATGAALIFGAWPAWAVTSKLQRLLPAGDRYDPRRSNVATLLWRSRTLLVMTQAFFAALFLTVAVLLSVSLWNLLAVNPGYAVSHRMVLSMQPAVNQPLSTADAARRYYGDLRAKLAAQPGVVNVAITTEPPLGWGGDYGFQIENELAPRDPRVWAARQNVITSNYISLMQIGIVAGRNLSSTDSRGASEVILVNQAFAQHFFPGRSALGQRVSMEETDGGQTLWREIVGVVSDIRDDRVGVAAAPEVYVPWEQEEAIPATPAFLIQSALPPGDISRSLRRVAEGAAPRDLIIGPETMLSRRERQLAFPRYRSGFAGIAAALALFFSTTGLYGLIAATLLQRRREIGVRLAVGATYRDVYVIFMRKSLKWTIPATAFGMFAAAGLISAFGSLIGGVSAHDVSAYAISMAALAASAALATVLPVRRALREDIMASLRSE